MRRWAVLAAGGLLVVAAACGRPAGQPGGPGAGPTLTATAPTSPTGPATPTALPPTSGTPVPADRVDASALPPAERHVLWTAEGGRTVGLSAEETGCTKLRLDVAEQSARQVRLVLVSTTTTHQVCPHYVRTVSVTATLDAPLGDRTVVLHSRQETR